MNKEKKDLLVFGYGLGVIALFFGIGGWVKHGLHLAPIVLLSCSVIFIATAALNYKAFKPGYQGWMKVAHLIGMVVTAVILSAVFFLVFTPVSLFLKLMGKDHMDRSLKPLAQTYWIKRTWVFQKENYKQQF